MTLQQVQGERIGGRVTLQQVQGERIESPQIERNPTLAEADFLMEVIIGLIIGAALGFLIGWLIGKGRAGKEQSQQQAEIAGLQGQLAQTATAEQLLSQAKEQFSAAAELSAAAALKGNSEEFLKLANENLGRTMEQAKGEFDKRHLQFQELVKPLADNYGKLNPQLEALMQQSQTLAAATGKLSSALTDVRQVAHWGEVQLRKVVEMANMTAYSDFAEQATIGGGEQDRPDLIVRLPEGRTVVIDAKASIAAALEAQGMDDETAANAAWERHAVNLKAQVTNLSRKGYGSKVEGSLDFVVMFVPGDQFLAAALKSDAGLGGLCHQPAHCPVHAGHADCHALGGQQRLAEVGVCPQRRGNPPGGFGNARAVADIPAALWRGAEPVGANGESL